MRVRSVMPPSVSTHGIEFTGSSGRALIEDLRWRVVFCLMRVDSSRGVVRFMCAAWDAAIVTSARPLHWPLVVDMVWIPPRLCTVGGSRGASGKRFPSFQNGPSAIDTLARALPQYELSGISDRGALFNGLCDVDLCDARAELHLRDEQATALRASLNVLSD